MDASSGVIELYLLRGCCTGDSYALAAHSQSLLFTLSNPASYRGCDRVLRDANSVPLLSSRRRKGLSFKTKIDVYRGDFDCGGSLAFTIKESSVFSDNLHIFMAGSSLKGPPNYKIKVATFSYSFKIFQQEVVVAKAKQGFGLCKCSSPDYIITTFLDMDQAMVVLIAAIFDDLRRLKSSAS